MSAALWPCRKPMTTPGLRTPAEDTSARTLCPRQRERQYRHNPASAETEDFPHAPRLRISVRRPARREKERSLTYTSPPPRRAAARRPCRHALPRDPP